MALGAGAPAAGAEVVPGQPDETVQQAYPISAGQTYGGAFQDTTSFDDVDYLAFQVTQAGQRLQFTVANTTQACNDPNDAGCPVYATLMDSADQQVGGDTSPAGTIATYGDTEVFQWTFATPGTYYLLMESNGDEAPGNPSYAVSYDSAQTGSGGAGGSGGSGGPGTGGSGGSGGSGGTGQGAVVRSLVVAPRQQGPSVRARVLLGLPASRLSVTLQAPRPGNPPALISRLVRFHLAAGTHRLSIPLSRAYRNRLSAQHRLSIWLKLTATTPAGRRATLSRHVTLRG